MIPILRPPRRRGGPTRTDEARVGRNLRASRLGILTTIVVLLLAGCGRKGGGGGGSGTVHVCGKVTHKGAALPGGTLAFVPDVDMGGSGDVTTVEIKPDGTYSVETLPGCYRITVSGPPSAGVPACYADPQLCRLSCEVKPGTTTIHDIPLN
jgi:hypothetical protein